MNIYLCSQWENRGYDTYDSFVCVANSEDEARSTLPSSYFDWDENPRDWCESPDKVDVTLLGKANEDQVAGVICSSYNAG
tara:strand:- start:180 stop:419 length:240 start_codon:yes stop_codon:yes gene_type:complete